MYKAIVVLAVFLVILTAISCVQKAEVERFEGGAIGIVSMMRNPKNLGDWLRVHRKLGIARFYIRLEAGDSKAADDEVVRMLEAAPDVTLEHGSNEVGADLLQKQMDRQCAAVDRALKLAAADNIAWLIHIDSDELLSSSTGNLDEIRALPSSVRTFYMDNDEAVYADIPRAGDNCFAATEFRDCSQYYSDCVSYVNGKSGGRVAPDVSCHGVHRFKSSHHDGNDERERKLSTIRLRHYESCDVEMYKKKFRHIAKDPDNDNPFPYYRDSIAATLSGDDVAVEAVYRKYRVA